MGCLYGSFLRPSRAGVHASNFTSLSLLAGSDWLQPHMHPASWRGVGCLRPDSVHWSNESLGRAAELTWTPLRA